MCATLNFAGVAAAQDQLRVAVLDVAKIFGGYYKTREVGKTLADSRAAAEQQLGARLEVHHRLLEETARIDKKLADPALNASAKADLQKQRDDKTLETRAQEQGSQELQSSTERNLQELSVRLRNQIVEDIMTVVRARVETKHYDLVLNKSAQITRGKKVVLYANASLEITDDVLTTLNGNRPAPAATPEDSSPDSLALPVPELFH